jgi:hypothetical protein
MRPPRGDELQEPKRLCFANLELSVSHVFACSTCLMDKNGPSLARAVLNCKNIDISLSEGGLRLYRARVV